MIHSLSILNYALIDKLEIEFNKGFSTITGETGAGKSILLGALSLILGTRADVNSLKDKSKKCIVEGLFNIKDYNLEKYFTENDIDYKETTSIRREININGKSRAFVNDTPVNLTLLKELGSKLVDIHSQHQNLIIGDNKFQLMLIDSVADNDKLLLEYNKKFGEYSTIKTKLADLIEKSEKSKSDFDYFQFQFDQLHEANLIENEQDELERELEQLNNSEDIKSNLSSATSLLSGENDNILDKLKTVSTSINNISSYLPEAEKLSKRIESTLIELKDISVETESVFENIEFDPNRIEEINKRVNLIYSLQQKHRVNSVADLIEVMNSFQEKLDTISSFDLEIEKCKKELTDKENLITELSDKLSKKRNKSIPVIEKSITTQLKNLGMPDVYFCISNEPTKEFTKLGRDKINFNFSANKKIEAQDLTKIASGGELSRLMLSIKAIISESKALPCIIFDEIDTGVSGEIADKMGEIMQSMAKTMQVISITHLPQIAGKGENHYVVYKDNSKETTSSNIRLLNKEERINEIAKMLSGKELTEAALENAKILILLFRTVVRR